MSQILVTGATGHLGAAVTENLIKKTNPANINVVVRDGGKAATFEAKGITAKIGDYNDYDSLVAAFRGIDKLYLVSGNDIANRTGQHENAVSAAKEAGVKHIVYTSFQHKNETETSAIAFIAASHLYTEKLIKASGITYTLLQHGLYADLIPLFAGEHLLDNKTIFLPAGEGKCAFATRKDFAEAGANVLLEETGKFDHTTIELAGSEAISWRQIASIISEITGSEIIYVSPSLDDFSTTLTKAGVPAEYIGLFSGFSQALAQGEFEQITGDLEMVLARKPVSVAEYLQSVYGKI
ncbi:SDR family oxidoreductase [Pedobacter hartonius]|uniref:NAD(P)H dehydrogenase (Quinone) n=1 Tax=Pedobacter hartonius TaxID=425514 RepID=A0A1H4BPV9_9SPHI|nr:SDR family oxidoreductase [Pedobacter hartonius]SEA50097.1 NAD(P)H dehydrogenase (quinone) [Pedobacter hartonius]